MPAISLLSPMIVREFLLKVTFRCVIVAGWLITAICSTIAIKQLVLRRRSKFFHNALLARASLFSLYSNASLLKMIVINTIASHDVVFKVVKGLNLVEKPVLTTLYNINIGFVFCFAYVVYCSCAGKVLKSSKALVGICVAISLVGVVLSSFSVLSVQRALLFRLQTTPAPSRLNRDLGKVQDVNNILLYMYGVGVFVSCIIVVVLGFFIRRYKGTNTRAYKHLILLTLSFIAFRSPAYLVHFFFEKTNYLSIVDDVLNAFHGVIDCLIIGSIVN
jgi:hypothetical protein